jgi:hypothetical protein
MYITNTPKPRKKRLHIRRPEKLLNSQETEGELYLIGTPPVIPIIVNIFNINKLPSTAIPAAPSLWMQQSEPSVWFRDALNTSNPSRGRASAEGSSSARIRRHPHSDVGRRATRNTYRLPAGTRFTAENERAIQKFWTPRLSHLRNYFTKITDMRKWEKVWVVGGHLPIPPAVRRGLTLGLKFSPAPYPRQDYAGSVIAMYSKRATARMNFMRASRAFTQNARIPNKRIEDHPDQKRYREMVRNPHLKPILDQCCLLNTDKNLGVAVVNRIWMREQCEKLLGDRNNYEVFEDSGYVYLKHIIKPFEELIKGAFPDDKQQKYLLGVTGIPWFYSVPKVHKKPMSSRPIVGAHTASTTRASGLLTDYLQSVRRKALRKLDEDQTERFLPIINSAGAKRRMELAYSRGAFAFVSYDFETMYPNMDPDWTRNMILCLLDKVLGNEPFKVTTSARIPYSWSPHSKKVIYDLGGRVSFEIEPHHAGVLIDGTMKHCWMQCEYLPGNLWHQKRGIAMGTNAAPELATLALATFELFHRPSTIGLPICRFIDDLLVAYGYPPTPEEETEVGNSYRESGLKLLPGIPGVFLDMRYSTEKKLTTSMYSKPGNVHQYIQAGTYYTPGAVAGVIIGGLKRINELNSEPVDRLINTIKFLAFLRNRGHSNTKCLSIIKRFEAKPPSNPNTNAKTIRIVCDFTENLNRSKFQRDIELAFPDLNPIAVYRSPPTLGARLNKHPHRYPHARIEYDADVDLLNSISEVDRHVTQAPSEGPRAAERDRQQGLVRHSNYNQSLPPPNTIPFGPQTKFPDWVITDREKLLYQNFSKAQVDRYTDNLRNASLALRHAPAITRAAENLRSKPPPGNKTNFFTGIWGKER